MSNQDPRIDVVAGTVNTWIVGDDSDVIVIDPGEDAAAVLAAVAEREVLAVICTHGHARHIAAALEVADPDEAPVALHPFERSAWRKVHDSPAEIEMEDDGRFEVAGVALEVVHAPGHSRGSVLLYSEDLGVAFTGDVVSSTGPVPHEDGYPNWARQVDAISAHVLTLPPETRLLPGHGEELTAGDAEKLFDSWVAAGQLPVDGAGAEDDREA
ncbi:MAG TPA: MBL fold metallo-hydrolase [Streptosporangiaceae bacterium]|jgi:glyoxylase-like metal-dependent hydrolase (beta-lactamase superfamily II)